MTNRTRRPRRSKKGFGFSSPGLRKLTGLLSRNMGVRPHERGQFQDIFANAIAGSFFVTGGVFGVMMFGWIGLFIGPIAGLGLAAAWFENDQFFH